MALPGLSLTTFAIEAHRARRGHSPYSQVPPLDPRASVLGSAVLDRTFTLAVNLLTGVPAPNQVRRAEREIEDAARMFEAEGWLDDPRSYHADPPAPDHFELRPITAREGRRKIELQQLSMPSGYQPQPHHPGRERWLGYEPNRTAHAWVLEHPGAARPWVVCVHGFMMGGTAANMRGFEATWLHEKLGLNVIMPVLPLHGPRAGGRVSGGELLSANLMNLILIFAQGAWDVRRAVAWARQRGAPRIALYGLSLGGYTSALTSCLEEGIDAIIAGIPLADVHGVARENMSTLMREYQRDLEVDWALMRRVSYPVSPLAMPSRVPREGRFIFAGIADRVVRPDQPRALWRHWEEPEIHWFSGGHVGYMWVDSIRAFVGDALAKSGLVVS